MTKKHFFTHRRRTERLLAAINVGETLPHSSIRKATGLGAFSASADRWPKARGR